MEREGRGPESEARAVGRVLGVGDLRAAEEAGRLVRTGRALPGASRELREGVRLGPWEFERTGKSIIRSVYVMQSKLTLSNGPLTHKRGRRSRLLLLLQPQHRTPICLGCDSRSFRARHSNRLSSLMSRDPVKRIFTRHINHNRLHRTRRPTPRRTRPPRFCRGRNSLAQPERRSARHPRSHNRRSSRRNRDRLRSLMPRHIRKRLRKPLLRRWGAHRLLEGNTNTESGRARHARDDVGRVMGHGEGTSFEGCLLRAR